MNILKPLVCVLVSFASTAHAEAPFVLRLTEEVKTIDWQLGASLMLSTNLMEGMTALGDDLQPKPLLAKGWTISRDGKTYTFEIDRERKWSDGKNLSANDFVFAWHRLLAPETASGDAYYLFDIVGSQEFNKGEIKDFAKVGVRALDDAHLEIKLRQRTIYWPAILSFQSTYPLRANVVEKYGKAWTEPGKIVTIGPYRLDDIVRRQKYLFSRNPYYPAMKGNIEKFVALVVNDDRTAMNLFDSGKLDVLESVESVMSKASVGAQHFKALSTQALQFNTKKGALKNPALRRAIMMAVDRRIVGLLPEAAGVADGWVPPDLLRTGETFTLPYNPELARQELAKAGLNPAEVPPIEFMVWMHNSEEKIALFYQEELRKNLGLKVDIKPVEGRVGQELAIEGRYDVKFVDWTADYADADNFLSYFTSQSGNNHSGWADPEFDRLITASRAEQNDKRRIQNYSRAQEALITREAVIIPMYHGVRVTYVSARTSNFVITPMMNFSLKDVRVNP